ncbi:hypothetical protein [Sporisorium scitamineum]|uniref:Uncharacterized protein n=1 Tax=Sporisorium scitamineum TaxID=49012 RepID=A0A0F7S419_9BASI|nr:hypothetical protein [Sporisorium scitamineum]
MTPRVGMKGDTASARGRRSAGVSETDLVKASQQTNLVDECAQKLRQEVDAWCAPPTPSASASAPSSRPTSSKVVKLASTTITSRDRSLTSPKAFLRCDPSTAGKRPLSFVGKVSIDDRVDTKALTLWFSSTQSAPLVIKKGSALYEPHEFSSCVQDGGLCRVSNVVRGKHKGEDCIMFERHSEWQTLDSPTTFAAIKKLNADLDSQLYPLRTHDASEDSVTRFRKIWESV